MTPTRILLAVAAALVATASLTVIAVRRLLEAEDAGLITSQQWRDA